MSSRTKIVYIVWGILMVFTMSIFLLPHHYIHPVSIISSILFLTIFVISIFIVIREKNKNNKLLFLHFGLFSSYFIILSLYPLMGITLFPTSTFASFLHYQYGTITYHILLLFAVVYLVVDMLFRQRPLILKYLLTFLIVGFASSSYYGSFFQDSKYLYNTPDIKDFGKLDKAYNELIDVSGISPSVEELSNSVVLSVWRDGKEVGELYPAENRDRIAELLPFVEGNNYLVLIMRPLNRANVLINTFTILFIILFFAYQYKKDPPQGAYIEKIMFLLLIFVSLESLHSWAYVRSVEWAMYMEFLVLGQYLSIGILALITMFFGLRLRFISSVQGEFYEQQLVSNPERISRWRDWVDNFVLSYIFNSQTLVGRLLAPGRSKR
jgi:hypothetical protein